MSRTRKETQPRTKCLRFADPSSPFATKHGFAIDGCYYVTTESTEEGEVVQGIFADRTNAERFANSLPELWHRWSLNQPNIA